MSVPVTNRTLRRKQRSLLAVGSNGRLGQDEHDNAVASSHVSCDENMMELLCNSVTTLTTDEHNKHNLDSTDSPVFNGSKISIPAAVTVTVATPEKSGGYCNEESSSSVCNKENHYYPHRQYQREVINESFESADSGDTDLVLNPYSPAKIKHVASVRRALAKPLKGKYVNWNNQVPQVYYSPPKKLHSYSRKTDQSQGKLKSRSDIIAREGYNSHRSRKPRSRNFPPLP